MKKKRKEKVWKRLTPSGKGERRTKAYDSCVCVFIVLPMIT